MIQLPPVRHHDGHQKPVKPDERRTTSDFRYPGGRGAALRHSLQSPSLPFKASLTDQARQPLGLPPHARGGFIIGDRREPSMALWPITDQWLLPTMLDVAAARLGFRCQ